MSSSAPQQTANGENATKGKRRRKSQSDKQRDIATVSGIEKALETDDRLAEALRKLLDDHSPVDAPTEEIEPVASPAPSAADATPEVIVVNQPASASTWQRVTLVVAACLLVASAIAVGAFFAGQSTRKSDAVVADLVADEKRAGEDRLKTAVGEANTAAAAKLKAVQVANAKRVKALGARAQANAKKAREAGYSSGKTEGYVSGQAVGYSSGKDDGYSSGASDALTYCYYNYC